MITKMANWKDHFTLDGWGYPGARFYQTCEQFLELEKFPGTPEVEAFTQYLGNHFGLCNCTQLNEQCRENYKMQQVTDKKLETTGPRYNLEKL